MKIQRPVTMPKVVSSAKLPLVIALAFLFCCFGCWPGLALATGAAAIPTAQEVATSAGIPTVSLAIFIINIVRIFFGLLGVIAVLLLLYGGFIWMTSGGDPNKVDKAKQIIYNAIIGLIIIFSAFAIASFVISFLSGISGGPGGPGGPGGTGGIGDYSRSAIGGGPIESVYPRPNQTNVPINTRIVVTFKENIDPASICDLSGGGAFCSGQTMKNVQICQASATSSVCLNNPEFNAAAFSGTVVYQAKNTDFKTFVFSTNKYLGNEDELNRVFSVKLENGIIATSTKKSIFTGFRYDSYIWSFKTNGRLDLTPPEIQKFEIYPFPDQSGMEDVYIVDSQATAGAATVTFNANPNYEEPIKIGGKYYLGQSFAETDRPTLEKFAGSAVSPSFKFYITVGGGFNVISPRTSENIGFLVSGGSDYVTFYDGDVSGVTYGAANQILGINYSTAGDCSGKDRCLPISGKRAIETGAGLKFEATGDLVAGTAWRFAVSPAKPGDYLTLALSSSTAPINFLFNTSAAVDPRTVITKTAIGPDGRTLISIDYQTVIVSSTNILTTAQNLVRVINGYNRAAQVVSSSAMTSPARVVISAKNSGTNRFYLTQSAGSASRFGISGNLSGQAKVLNWQVKGVRDPYNNSVFRITFTEPVSPINLDASILVNINGVNVVASTSFSNQYRTLELMGTHPCGVVNSCGRPMYCWLDPNSGGVNSSPANITIKANTLKSCASTTPTTVGDENTLGNEWCKTWGGACNSSQDQARCKLSTGLYYPQSSAAVDGIIDMANNSFNGNFNTAPTAKGVENGNAQGPYGGGNGHSGLAEPYNLNSSVVDLKPTYNIDNTRGDDFYWSFFVSSQIDNKAPLLTSIKPVGDASYGLSAGETFSDPIKMTFNTLMRMATLKPGWGYADFTTDPDWSLRYLVLKTITSGANPVGYWASARDIDFDGDGFADYTIANLEHNPFDLSVRYGPLAGSGLESITQNCFLPGNGPQNAGDTSTSTVPGGLTINNCIYQADGSTRGCVTDRGIPDINRVTSTNPASYGYLNCREIDGAVLCANHCKVHYATSTDSANGSWIITKDKPAVTDSATGATGCCFGVCK